MRGFSVWRWPTCLAILGAWTLAGAGERQEFRKDTIFQSVPSFEEDKSAGTTQYIWRDAGDVVLLARGATVSITTQGRADVRLTFPGANLQSEPSGERLSENKTFYYLRAEKNWHVAQHFGSIRYPQIYPGIDLVFVTTGNLLEFNFDVAPYADPGVIRIRFEGAILRLKRLGDLEMSTGKVTIALRRPHASQNSTNRSIECKYGLRNSHEVVLRLGAYDRLRALFIDPVLAFSTYLGGSSFDSIYGAASDAQGNLYVTGETSSGSLTNASLPPRSSRDAFIAKINSAGTQVSVAYLGGSNYDSGRGIALDPSGNIYVTGVTESSDFPVTNGALLSRAPGSQGAFVTKFSPSFTLQYSTYLGGGSADSGLAIAVDSSGAAYVTGQTQSIAFPVTSSAFQKSNAGGISDCFISKLNPAGSALDYSTFLGGSGLDLCAGIAVDTSGSAYVAGTTYSTNFPLADAMQSGLLGNASAFVAKLSATGSALVYSTYVGGSNIDNATAITVDSTGAAYVTGDTASIDFPMTPGVFQSQLNGLYNAFVFKLSPAGNAMVYSTLLGGSGSDVGTSISIDPTERAIVGGYTSSSNFPTSGAVLATFGGVFDAFAAVLSPNAATLLFSSYFGGAGDDRGYAVAAGPSNNFYLAGMTSSTNFPVTAAFQSMVNTPPDAFVSRISYVAGAPADVSVTPNSGSGTSQTFALQYSDTAGAGSLQRVWVWFNATLSGTGSSSCLLYYDSTVNQINLMNDAGNGWTAAVPGVATTLHNSQCSVNVGASSLSESGNTLTWNLAMTFLSAYAGAKNIYMYAADVSGANSGWQSLGTWTVPSGALTVGDVSVTPNSGSGASQTFALQYSDTAGAGSLQRVWVWFNATLSGTGASSCLLYYDSTVNQINLMNDAGNGWTAAVPGAATTLQNSQCLVNVGASSLSKSGNTLTWNLAMTFLSAYAGAKNIYMYAADVSGGNSGWQSLGTWTVPSGALTVGDVSVTPNSGSGASQTFALQYSDTAGAGSLQRVWVWFNSTLSGTGSSSCLLYYDRTVNQINLMNDAGTGWTAATPGAATTLQNSQCSVNVGASSLSKSGNTLTWNLAMTYQAGFSGLKNVYMYAADVSGTNSGWHPLGTWTVT
jgi:hypothetical protein